MWSGRDRPCSDVRYAGLDLLAEICKHLSYSRGHVLV